MGTITSRRRKGGSIAYTAQVRIMRGGNRVYAAQRTFETEKAAAAWITREEKAMARPGAVEAAARPRETLGDAIDRYVLAYEAHTRVRRT